MSTEDDGTEELWYTAECECDLCYHLWQGILPVDDDWIICPECGNLAPSPEVPEAFFAEEPPEIDG